MQFLWDFFKDFGKEPLCNRQPDRALHIGDFVFPLCYRCMMITLGLIITLIVLLVLIDKIKQIKKLFSVGIILIIPTFIDGLVQTLSSYTSNNFKRATTGFLAGIGLAICVICFIKWLLKRIFKKDL